jgi:hypothetical protein
VRRALAVVAALAVSAIVAPPAAAQTVAPVDCARPVMPAILRVIQAAVGLPFELVTYAGIPGCDAPGDPMTATIGWSDGTTSTVAGVVPATGGLRLSATHRYARPGSFAIGVQLYNGRTGVTTGWVATQAEVVETGVRTMPERLRRHAGVGFRGRVVAIRLGGMVSGLRTFRTRIAWGDGRHSPGTVTFRGDMLEVAGRHTWRRPLRGRITVTVTDEATGGVLTIRRPVRIIASRRGG